jgi:hypothetical protein
MIVNHKYRFIFNRNPKAAGKSLHKIFSKLCDGNDILEEYDRTSKQKKSEKISNNLINKKKIIELIFIYIFHNTFQLIKYIPFSKKIFAYKSRPHFKRFQTYHNHMSIKKIKKNVGSKIFDNYYKFTVVRNPFDQILSYYNFLTENNDPSVKDKNFKKFINSYAEGFFKVLEEILMIDKKLVYNKYLKFENLENELSDLFKALDIDKSRYLGSYLGKSKIQKDYSLFDSESIEMVLKHANFIFDNFNYEKNLSIVR